MRERKPVRALAKPKREQCGGSEKQSVAMLGRKQIGIVMV